MALYPGCTGAKVEKNNTAAQLSTSRQRAAARRALMERHEAQAGTQQALPLVWYQYERPLDST